MRWRRLLGRRVVLRTRNSLSYAGRLLGVRTLPSGRRAVIVEVDSLSGFAIACPLDWVEEILEVRIGEN